MLKEISRRSSPPRILDHHVVSILPWRYSIDLTRHLVVKVHIDAFYQTYSR